jgi:hypothetical protein
LRKSEIERMQRRLFTERYHAESLGDILRRCGRWPRRNAIPVHCTRPRKAQEGDPYRRQNASSASVATAQADPTPAARLPVYAPPTRTASFLRA